jgi:hypothetical protein
MGKLLFALFFCLVLMVAVGASIELGLNRYWIERDIYAWQTRAQVSSEPNDMHAYMLNVQAGMERWGITHGYAELIFTTPENDMALIYKTVQQLVEQSQALTTMNRYSPEYQTGLDNLRGSIRELHLYAWQYWAVHAGLKWLILCFGGWIGCFVLFIVAMARS